MAAGDEGKSDALTRRTLLRATFAVLPIAGCTTIGGEPDPLPLEGPLEGPRRRFDPAIGLLGEPSAGPGYHTTMPRGTWVHPTRTNLNYALRLFRDGSPAAVARACGVTARVIALQDSVPASRTFGLWSYYLEEPLSRMAPPDENWADFNGARLAEILARYRSLLPDRLAADTARALGNAARFIVVRDVGPAYTNIAAMGARVTLAAGEILHDEDLLAYGRRRLRRLLDYTREQGSFNEYNSPTYTLVALKEFEAVEAFVRDPQALSDAEALRRIAWELIAAHFHPPTRQWAGPHGRAYGDRLGEDLLADLAIRTGVPLSRAVPEDGADIARPCPDDLKPRFVALPSPVVLVHQRFIRVSDDRNSLYGTTLLTSDLAVGSANAETFWTQRHPLIAYWPATLADHPAAVLRVRFLKDGRDFASFGLVTRQVGSRVLLGVHPVAGAGDFHTHLDRPADGRFTARSLVLRFVLDGVGCTATDLAPDRVALTCGRVGAIVHKGPGVFDGQAALPRSSIRWRTGHEGDSVFLDAICHEGEPITFAAERLGPTMIAAGLELVPADRPGSNAPVLAQAQADGTARLSWEVEGMEAIACPTRAVSGGSRAS